MIFWLMVLAILSIVIIALIIMAPNHLQDQTMGLSASKDQIITTQEKQLNLLIAVLVLVFMLILWFLK